MEGKSSDGRSRKWFVKMSVIMRYKSNVLEAISEDVAVREYREAVSRGFVSVESIEELDMDVAEELTEELANE